MKKQFVFDTNVLLHDPQALFKFEDNDVIVPIYVIEEIDSFKRDMSELGRNAREVSRILDRYREKGNLGKGVELPGGGKLQVWIASKKLELPFLSANKMDNLILVVALEIREKSPDIQTIILSKDVNLRVRADALGLKAQNYEEQSVVSPSEMYTGHVELGVSASMISDLHQSAEGIEIDLEDREIKRLEGGNDRLFLNEYVLLRSNEGAQTSFGRVSETDERGVVATLRPVPQLSDSVWSIKPRNKEQLFALNALLDDSIDLVTLVGKAGTGKTLLAIAAGLRKVTDEQKHHKLLVARPVIPLGKDIGFLPGTMEEKLGPWMRPIFDNVEFLMGVDRQAKRAGRGADELIDMGIIEIEALTYIRGRSLPHQYIIIDEAQNLTPHEAKTILTRVGEGTKMVLTGDPYQIDNPYVDVTSNGLSYVLERFKGQRKAATITLTKGERSELAELAANLL